MFCYDTLVRLVKCKASVPLSKFKIEEVEESRVCQHDGASLSAFFYNYIAMFYLSTLAHHPTSLLHLWAHRLDVVSSLRPHKEIGFITHQVYAIRVLVPRVDSALAPGIIAHQDDEHQRHHQPCYIY